MVLSWFSRKLRRAFEMFWDVLEEGYYGRFSVHGDASSPFSRIIQVTIALTIAITLSTLLSVIAIPLFIPVLMCWCVVAPCGAGTRRIQSFFENCAAGTLIPFVCLWCSSVAGFKVVRVFYRSTIKSFYHCCARLRRAIDKKLHPPRKPPNYASIDLERGVLAADESAAGLAESPAADALATGPVEAPPVEGEINTVKQLGYLSKRSRYIFAFLGLPPELRVSVYERNFAHYQELSCKPTRLLRANKQFINAIALLRTCTQIRREAFPMFSRSIAFTVFSRYPFYRNMDISFLRRLRNLEVIMSTNSKGISGLGEIFAADIRRMSSLRSLTINVSSVDFTRDQDQYRRYLRQAKTGGCRDLELIKISVKCPRAAATKIRERLNILMNDLGDRWPPNRATFVSNSPTGSLTGPRVIIINGWLFTGHILDLSVV